MHQLRLILPADLELSEPEARLPIKNGSTSFQSFKPSTPIMADLFTRFLKYLQKKKVQDWCFWRCNSTSVSAPAPVQLQLLLLLC